MPIYNILLAFVGLPVLFAYLRRFIDIWFLHILYIFETTQNVKISI